MELIGIGIIAVLLIDDIGYIVKLVYAAKKKKE